MINKPTYEELEKENVELKAKVSDLSKVVIELLKRIEALEKQLGKNSENSSKPPSTDGFKKKIQNNRVKGEKKSGGQLGHKGYTLRLVSELEVSELKYLEVTGICECGADMRKTGKIIGKERRQIWDIPELKPFIVEYQLEKKECTCGSIHKAMCDIGYSIQYGSRISALSCYLQNMQLLPINRIQELLSDIFGFAQISAGVILESSERCYEALSDWETRQKELLKSAAVLHTDETGSQVNGKRDWAHVCSTDTLTLYQYHRKRGKEAHEAGGILPFFKGILMHDRYSSYNGYDCKHSFCNAHLLRELKGLIEAGQIWAKDMYALLNEAYQGLHCPTSLDNHYQNILRQGFKLNPTPERVNARGKIKKSDSLLLLECFRDKKPEVFRFFYEQDVPFDNNQAERDIRMFKLKQKISGCFRTEKGAKIFCRVRSFISTVKKQGKNVWGNLWLIFSSPNLSVNIS